MSTLSSIIRVDKDVELKHGYDTVIAYSHDTEELTVTLPHTVHRKKCGERITVVNGGHGTVRILARTPEDAMDHYEDGYILEEWSDSAIFHNLDRAWYVTGYSGGRFRRNRFAFSFAALGDQDYLALLRPKKREYYERIIADINGSSTVHLTGHVGDFQDAGSSHCYAENYTDIKALFNTYNRPIVVTPGDNDWSDLNCVPDPLDNLTGLREALYPSSRSLGRRQLRLRRQSEYPENQRWTYRGVLFFTFHTIGGGTDKIRGGTISEDERIDEQEARRAANLAWIKESFRSAVRQRAKAVVIFTHAAHWISPRPQASPYVPLPAYAEYYQAIEDETIALQTPRSTVHVLLCYGDHHNPMFTQPMAVPEYWEIQVPGVGNPVNGWVEVIVDTTKNPPFMVMFHNVT